MEVTDIEIIKTIERVRRAQPRNTDVLLICDWVEKRIAAPQAAQDSRGGVESRHASQFTGNAVPLGRAPVRGQRTRSARNPSVPALPKIAREQAGLASGPREATIHTPTSRELKPWETIGISERTYYRRQAALRKVGMEEGKD